MLEAFTRRWSKRRAGVPFSWQTSQSVAADLHRRMHRAVDHTRHTVADVCARGLPAAGYERICDELDGAAGVIDTRLMVASRLPHKARSKALLELRYRIAELERICDRVGRSALDTTSSLVGNVDDVLHAIEQRLDHLAEAREELKELGGDA